MLDECSADVKKRMKVLVRHYSHMLRVAPTAAEGSPDRVFWDSVVAKRIDLSSPPTRDDEVLKVAIELARDAFKEPERTYYFMPSEADVVPAHCLHKDVLVLDALERLVEAGDVAAVNDYAAGRFTPEAIVWAWLTSAGDVAEQRVPLARLFALFQKIGRLNDCRIGRLMSDAVEQLAATWKLSPGATTELFGRRVENAKVAPIVLSWLIVAAVGLDYGAMRPITLWFVDATTTSPSAAAILSDIERVLAQCDDKTALAGVVEYYQADLSLKLMTGEIIDSHLNSSALVLAALYKANFRDGDEGIIAYTHFYNNTALEFDLRDMKQDFIRMIQSQREDPSIFAFCRYPFLIDANFKSMMMQLEAVLESEEAMRGTMLSSLFAGPAAQGVENRHFLILNINRSNLIQTALREIQRNGHNLNRPLRVRFTGEDGIDEGGVRKEFFQLLCKMLLDPDYGMFTSTPEARTLWFVADVRNSSNRSEFRLIGQTLGLAVYNNVMLDVSFPHLLYRLILRPQSKLTLADLAEIDPSLEQGMRDLLDFEEVPDEGLTVEDVFCRTFVFEHDVYGEKVEVPLIPGGESKPLTGANRREFVDAVVEHVLRGAIAKNFAEFREGFLSVCNRPLFSSMRPEELELLVCGSSALDFKELEETTRYDGYKPTDSVIVNFWQVVRNELTLEQQKKFLKFCTGSDKVPIRGLGDLRFVIGKNGDDSEMLPTSHTCFNHFLLPAYTTKEKLKEKLILAIQNCEGFGLK